MTQQQIIEKVHGLKTKMDLLNLLNELKREDLGKDGHRFTLNQINFYCNPNRNPKKRYKDSLLAGACTTHWTLRTA